MKGLFTSFEVVIPIFLLIALGYFLRKIKLLDGNTIEKLNNLVFNVLFPIMIFNSLYDASLSQTKFTGVIIFSVAYLIVIFALSLIIIPRLEKQDAKRSVLIQSWFRAFTMLFGFAIITSLYGQDSTAIIAIVVAVAVPIRNVLGVVTLELYGKDKSNVKKMLVNIIKNPLIIGCVLGLAAMSIDFEMPYVISKPLGDISKVGSPLALITLGAFFEFSQIKKNIKPLLVGLLGRMIITPVIFMVIAILFGFRDIELVTILMVVGVPVGTATFVMSHQMGGDSELAAQLIVLGTCVSAVTIFLWIFVLKNLALIA